MRILGLDYGSKTVGTAVSDAGHLIAQPLETITRTKEDKLRKTFARIEALIDEYDIGLIVLGLPLNMDDTEGERAAKTRTFKEALERRTGLEVVLQDERLSTFSAEEVLEEMGVKKADMKQYVDKIAASYILQDYLDVNKEQAETKPDEI